ncbi:MULTISPECIES: nucleotide disphospho-sugar-binding domain-containing protein [unclassified Streptomyces]|uniref:nucleotide disphospho-sugar-binding domain-containing protein n=1 Tax=unclassified Streptomyces TaxID=2593676 RepID=UPI00336A3645
MRVLFVTFPGRSHFQLNVPLAWALRTAGHEVHVASAPEFADVVTGAGLAAVAVQPSAEDLVEYCRWWRPDLVIGESASQAGAVAAAAVGAPHARMRPVFGEEYGDPPEEPLTGRFTIDQTPGSLRPESGPRTVSVRYVPYDGPSVVPEWSRRDAELPRVLAAFGVSKWNGGRPVSAEEAQEMLDATADLDIELVLTLPAGIRRTLQRVPAHARIVDFAPLHVLLPSCSAVVHRGGLPAFCGAPAYGVPQLMVGPGGPESRARGGRLAEVRAGLWIPPEAMSGPRFREDLVRLLDDPSFRSGAEGLRQEMLAQPSPNDVVPELEKRVAEYGSR